MEETELSYSIKNQKFTGSLVYHAGAKRPGVLVIPTWMGFTPFIREKARALAELGYFGKGAGCQRRGLAGAHP